MPTLTNLPPLVRTVRIPIAQFGKYETRFGREVVRELFNKAMPTAGRAVRHMLEEETIRRAIFHKGKYARGWRMKRGRVSGLSVEVMNKQPYAIVVEKGRRPNRRPPPSSVLVQWVKDKLGVPAKDARRVAFLVARAIGRRGIKGRPILNDPKMQIKIRKTAAGAVMLHIQEGMKRA